MASGMAAATGVPALGIAAAGGGLTLQAFVAEGLKAMGGGIGGNLTHSGVVGGYDALVARLTDAAKRGRLPENHDLIRALRRSQLDALRFMVESYTQRAITDPDYDGDVARAFRSAARQFLSVADKTAEKGKFFIGEAVDPSTPRVATEQPESFIEWMWDEGSRASLLELSEATRKQDVPAPQAFVDWYASQYGSNGFAIVAQQFFSERLKTNERVRTALFQHQLQSIGARLNNALHVISRIDGNITEIDSQLGIRFDALEEKIDLLTSRYHHDTDKFVDILIKTVAEPTFREELQRVFGAYCPHDEWRSSLASKDVADRMDSLLRQRNSAGVSMSAFFGREDQLEWLDDWIESRDRGLLVGCAPSGGGKSALLARWCEHRQFLGDHLARHFVSIRFPITTSPTGCLQHLLAQLREIDRAKPTDREAVIPSDEKDLFDAIHARLKQPAEDGKRLLLVIDAMDELDAPLRDCFARSDIGKGNFVIVSRRAEPNVVPLDLQKWLTAKVGDERAAVRYDVPPMRSDDVVLWLEEFLGDVPAHDMVRMSEKLARVTNGLPLFLKYVIASLIEAFAQGLALEERVETVMNLRDPFAGFLADFISGELAGVQDRLGRPFTQSEMMLMAIMTQTFGPLSQNELAAVYDRLSKTGTGLSGIDIVNLDPRLSRWLSIRPAPKGAFDASPRFAFDHPRLAIEFSHVLGSETTGKAIEAVIEWAEAAWRPTTLRFTKSEQRGSQYALRHLAQHLLEQDCFEEAACVLTDMAFIRERFLSFTIGDASEMMYLDWARWGAIFDRDYEMVKLDGQ